jgi:hypothetical protein
VDCELDYSPPTRRSSVLLSIRFLLSYFYSAPYAVELNFCVVEVKYNIVIIP